MLLFFLLPSKTTSVYVTEYFMEFVDNFDYFVAYFFIYSFSVIGSTVFN